MKPYYLIDTNIISELMKALPDNNIEIGRAYLSMYLISLLFSRS